jgi:hypothetical protein
MIRRARRAARGHRRRATRTDWTLPPRAGGGGGGGGGEGVLCSMADRAGGGGLARGGDGPRLAQVLRCAAPRARPGRVPSFLRGVQPYTVHLCLGVRGPALQYCVASQLRRVAQVRRKYNVVKPNHIISYRLACHPASLSAFFASLSAHPPVCLSVCPSGGRHPPSDSATASPPLVGAASHSPSVCASPCLPSGKMSVYLSRKVPYLRGAARRRTDPTFAICV